MANWTVRLYETSDGERVVAAELRALGHTATTKIIHAAARLMVDGTSATEPLVKHLGGDLWELRPDRYRVLYFAMIGQRFVFLRAFQKKTPKTPRGEIVTALKRMYDYRARHGGG